MYDGWYLKSTGRGSYHLCKMDYFVRAMTIFLFVVAVSKSTHGNEHCSPFNDSLHICYFEMGQASWTKASILCEQKNATLPIIRNEEEQEKFTNYLKSYSISSPVWTAGTKYTFDGWKWLDGRPYDEDINGNNSLRPSHACLDRNLSLTARYPHVKNNHYICEFQGHLCRIKSSCLNISNTSSNWYEARNDCLQRGGDLAVFNGTEVTDLQKLGLVLYEKRRYWIGLRTRSWIWNYSNAATFGCLTANMDVKYTNWENASDLRSDNSCIAVDVSNGKWEPKKCQDRNVVVCQKVTTGCDIDLTTTTPNPRFFEDPLKLYSTAGGAILILILIIIIVIVACKKSGGGTVQTKEDAMCESVQMEGAQGNPAAPTKDSVENTQCVYAEVRLGNEVNGNKSTSGKARPEILYADLEFQHKMAKCEKPKAEKASTNATLLDDTAAYAEVFHPNANSANQPSNR